MTPKERKFWKQVVNLEDPKVAHELRQEEHRLITSLVRAGAASGDVKRFAEICFITATRAGISRGFKYGWKTAHLFSQISREKDPGLTILKMLAKNPHLSAKEIADNLDRNRQNRVSGKWLKALQRKHSKKDYQPYWIDLCDRRDARLAASFDEYITRFRKLAKRLENLRTWKRVFLDKKPMGQRQQQIRKS